MKKKIGIVLRKWKLIKADSATSGVKGTFTDRRDGKEYKTVKIGTQTWMAENLNYNAIGSKCYGEGGIDYVNAIGYDCYEQEILIAKPTWLSAAEVQANCEKYGRLYDWNTALKSCPSGWHLPSDREWEMLIVAVGGKEAAGGKLKAKSGWDTLNGTDEYGFSALPGGCGHSGGSFNVDGCYGYWWSSTAKAAKPIERVRRLPVLLGARNGYADYAWCRCMSYADSDVKRNASDKSNLFSVRCVKD